MRGNPVAASCVVILLTCASGTEANGPFFFVDISNRQSHAACSHVENSVLIVDVAAALELPPGTPMVLNGIGWNLVLQAVGTSGLNEAQAHFTSLTAPGAGGPTVTPGMFFGPGNNDNEPMFFVIFTPVKLEFLQQNDLILHDGRVRIELCESFDNGPGPDTLWQEGVLVVQAVPGCQRGDVNCDASVDLDDVLPFIDALLDTSALSAGAHAAADVNRDGLLNGADTADFVECLEAGGCP